MRRWPWLQVLPGLSVQLTSFTDFLFKMSGECTELIDVLMNRVLKSTHRPISIFIYIFLAAFPSRLAGPNLHYPISPHIFWHSTLVCIPLALWFKPSWVAVANLPARMLVLLRAITLLRHLCPRGEPTGSKFWIFAPRTYSSAVHSSVLSSYLYPPQQLSPVLI